MLTLHQYEISPFADKIRRILNWKAIPYQVVNHPLAARAAVKKINDVGKVPVLEHDGRFIADSTDIAEYLEQQFPDKPLFPEDPQRRAQMHILEDWADESLYFMEICFRFCIAANAKRNLPRLLADDRWLVRKLFAPVIRMAMGSLTRNQGIGRKSPAQWQDDLRRHCGALALYLGDQPWLLGQQLTLADLSVFVQLSCIHETDEGREIIVQHPSVSEWLERVDLATRAQPRETATMTSTETILITGCSSGIGYATARLAIQRGHKVLVSAMNEAELRKVPAGATLAVILDVCNTASVERAVQEVEEQVGPITVLINNAGVCQPGPIELLTDEQLHRQFDINVYGIVRTVRAVLPSMRAQGRGTIINLSSLLGRVTMPLIGGYCASKHAVEAISDALRMELKPMGIRVQLIEPGWIRSNFAATAEELASDELREANPYLPLIESSDAKQGDLAAYEGTPEDVAEVIVAALEHRNNRPRIPVTFLARLLLSFNLLPTRLRDKLILKMMT